MIWGGLQHCSGRWMEIWKEVGVDVDGKRRDGDQRRLR